MIYPEVVQARFIVRPNRFIAHVELDGHSEVVHVKNTGRCKELLVPGAEVYLSHSSNPARSTQYDLIAVVKEGRGLINIDSQAPNQVVKEFLADKGFDLIRPEYGYGRSRIDFYLERGEEKILMEVKGCTLEVDGIGYFPDAPTERGTRHLRELMRAARAGYRAIVAFVIQMEGIREVYPNAMTDPAFANALAEAQYQGVEIWNLGCSVAPDRIAITSAERVTTPF